MTNKRKVYAGGRVWEASDRLWRPIARTAEPSTLRKTHKVFLEGKHDKRKRTNKRMKASLRGSVLDCIRKRHASGTSQSWTQAKIEKDTCMEIWSGVPQYTTVLTVCLSLGRASTSAGNLSAATKTMEQDAWSTMYSMASSPRESYKGTQ